MWCRRVCWVSINKCFWDVETIKHGIKKVFEDEWIIKKGLKIGVKACVLCRYKWVVFGRGNDREWYKNKDAWGEWKVKEELQVKVEAVV